MKKEYSYKLLYKCGCRVIAYEYNDDDNVEEYTIFCDNCYKNKFNNINKIFENIDNDIKINEEKIIKDDDKIICECGTKYNIKYKKRHLISKKHKEFLEKII